MSQRIRRHPGANPVLFLAFSDLDTNNLASLAWFAGEYGPLGYKEFCKEVDWSRQPAEVELQRWALGMTTFLTHRARDVGHKGRLTDPVFQPLWAQATTIESYSIWVHSIAEMRAASVVLEMVRAGDAEELRELFRWGKFTPDEEATGWVFDTRPELPVQGRTTVSVRRCIQSNPTLTPFTPIETVALTYLTTEVSSQLERRVNPVLTLTADGRVTELLRSETLSTMMWTQLFTAISEGTDHKKCPAPGCGVWFEIGGRAGKTVRRVYCSDKCRVRACESRRVQAIQLSSEGLAVKEIVDRFHTEGHETDAKTVQKWIKSGKKK